MHIDENRLAVVIALPRSPSSPLRPLLLLLSHPVTSPVSQRKQVPFDLVSLDFSKTLSLTGFKLLMLRSNSLLTFDHYHIESR